MPPAARNSSRASSDCNDNARARSAGMRCSASFVAAVHAERHAATAPAREATAASRHPLLANLSTELQRTETVQANDRIFVMVLLAWACIMLHAQCALICHEQHWRSI